MAMDLRKNRYASWAELEGYCDKVAGAVGLLCVRIFGRNDQAGRDYAFALGRALQLTNILRDLGEDAKAGKIYLPSEDLERFRIQDRDILAGLGSPALMDLLKFEAARARSFFKKAKALARESGALSLLAGEIMRETYETLLRRVEIAGPEVLDRKVRLSLPVRAWASARALGRSLLS
jgi:phytoene synthase